MGSQQPAGQRDRAVGCRIHAQMYPDDFGVAVVCQQPLERADVFSHAGRIGRTTRDRKFRRHHFATYRFHMQIDRYAVARRDMAEAARLVPDEAVEAFTITGTPKQCVDRLMDYVDAGVNEPVLSIVGGDEGIKQALGIVAELSGAPPANSGST